MPHRTFFQSLNDAVEGFFYVVKNERNMRIHFFLAFFIVLSGALLGVRGLEWVVLCTALTFLLVAEMINTVVEEITDFVESSTHPTVRIIKDMSAGAVLLSAVNALVVVFFIFSKHVTWPLQFTALQVRHAPWHVSFIALLMIVFLVVTVKTVFHRGAPFRGGPVSGHAAVAFSLWTAVLFVQDNPFVIGAAFLLALFVAQSRLRDKIHTFWEVAAGAAMGILVTAIFFKLFR